MVFSETTRRKIRQIRDRYPERKAALIPSLFLVQEEHGSLNAALMEALAEELELPAAEVLNTVTFYSMFRLQPRGRYRLQVCRNLACHLRGGDKLLETLSHKLGIIPGETSEDGMFSLETVECLASCGTAPVLQVDDVYHENMTPEKLENLLDRLREEAVE